jgi:hypothetical protein
MLNRVNGKRELDQVNMLIRALSDEMTQERTQSVNSDSRNTIPVQMEEALYQLRLRKLVISALVGSNHAGAVSH